MTIIAWNIEGLQAKIDCNSTYDLLNNHDIIILGETHTLTTFNYSLKFDNYEVHHSPAQKFTRHGRPSGGLAVLIRKDLIKHTEVIDTKTDSIIAIKIKKGGTHD